MSSERRTVSFVIPAFNEAEHIGRCVESIHRHVPEGMTPQIIVVDNGSTDATASIATEAGATVVHSDATTISGVRNHGIARATGEVFVFLDGDCALTHEWSEHIDPVLDEMLATPMNCAGSQVQPPASARHPVVRHWFGPFMERAAHIGSAHLICSRVTCVALDGFDEALETGEDYDFCTRLEKAGGRVIVAPRLLVEHYDFPAGWGDFVRRERWHGRGDTGSLRSVLGSKVLLVSLVFIGAWLAAGGLALTGHVAWGLAAVGVALLLPVAASFARLRGVGVATRLYSFPIFGLYFVGRSLSIWDALRRSIRARLRGSS